MQRTHYRVLLVDGDAQRASLTASKLSDERFLTECVESGLEALGRLDRRPSLDAAVIERDLPDLDGFELVERMRRKSRLDDTRAVVLAASAERASSPASRSGCDAYLVERDAAARGTIVAFAVRLLAA